MGAVRKTVEKYGPFDLTYVSHSISMKKYQDDIKTTLSAAFHSLDLTTISFSILTGGITNQVIWVKVPQQNGYVFRIYGDNTDKFIDREREIVNNQTASLCGVGPGVAFVFANGVCLNFAPGSTMKREDFADFSKGKVIANAFAKMHVQAACESQEALLDTKFFGTWLALVPGELDTESETAKLKAIRSEFEDLPRLCSDLLKKLEAVASPIVFCHNDLLCGNVLYDNDEVTFIDMEYGGPNYRGFDLADHFCEFAGLESPDFSLYPNKEFQVKWLRAYLEEMARQKGEDPAVTKEADVEKLYSEVNKFAPACHLMWGVWALLQAKYSKIDFDYLEYAHVRLTEYRKGLKFFEDDKLYGSQ